MLLREKTIFCSVTVKASVARSLFGRTKVFTVCSDWADAGRGDFLKIWVGVCSMLLETLTLFQTKICDFPYPISDLTDPKFDTLFQTRP